MWQTIDWSLPPVTYEGEGEMIVGESDEGIVEGAPASTENAPGGTDDAPVAIDLSEPTETSLLDTSVP